MVDWLGKFYLLLKRRKDSWMDMSPLSTMTEQQRQAQYLADMTRLNAERQGRCEAALDPNQPRNRYNWYATHLAAHERLFPYSDNLATWMFLLEVILMRPNDKDLQVLFFFVTLLLPHILFLSSTCLCWIVLCCEKLKGESIPPRERQRQQCKQNIHCGKTTQRINTDYGPLTS